MFLYIISSLLLIFIKLLKELFSTSKESELLKSLKRHERRQFDLLALGDFKRFKNYVEGISFDPDLRYPTNGRTLLLTCDPIDSKISFAKYLVRKGCDVNAVDKYGVDMVFMVSYSSCKRLFNFIVSQKRLNLNKSNYALGFEMNPLSACIYRNKYKKALKLLKQGADPRICRQIIEKCAENYEESYNKKYQILLEVYERWYNGSRILLLDYYLSKEKGVPKVPMFKRNGFAVEKLPLHIIRTLAKEYL